MSSSIYSTDLSDVEYALIHPHLPVASSRGRPRKHAPRAILNAIFYAVHTGCQWRLLPREFPPWQTVYRYFHRWRRDRTWERIHGALRELVRIQAGRHPEPSACIIDSQLVRTTGVGGVRGYDAGKKVNGRKRHLVVETDGLLLRVKVHNAAMQDRAAIPLVLEDIQRQYPRLQHAWVDQGYTGKGRDWMRQQLRWTVQVVGHPPKPRGVWAYPDEVIDWDAIIPKGFRGVLPRRWVIERTFAWLSQSRRLSKDYERLCETSEALIHVAMMRLMTRRIAQR